MKKLNKQAVTVFNSMIALLGTQDSIKIDNAPGEFMYVSIEKLQSDVQITSCKFDIYSIAHYYEQNGDLCCDPDMTFAVCQSDPMFIYPMTFQNSICYRQGIFEDGGVWKINEKEQADEVSFANMWLKNIKFQQGL